MLTQLNIQFLRLMHRWKMLLFILGFPVVIIWFVLPFLNTAIEQSTVPVAWVDQDKTEFSTLVKERVSDSSRLSLVETSENRAEQLVQRGEVEAAFILASGFEKQLRSGEAEEVIRWMRTESSSLDTFAKEQIAAESIRLMLNSRAGVFVQTLSEDITFEEAFQKADSYWEPQPLFRMEYERIQPGTERGAVGLPLSLQGLLSLLLVYGMGVQVFLMKVRYEDAETGRLQRLKVTRGNAVSYYTNVFFLHLAFLGVLIGIVCATIVVRAEIDLSILNPWVFRLGILLVMMQIFVLLLAVWLPKPKAFFFIMTLVILTSVLLKGSPVVLFDTGGFGEWLPHGWLFNEGWRG
ncbi:ABC transporter permease [Thalassobacillus hwangdonensis]|uniref:ABC transporter permease n=1 Tax=Thalassobacillus hwangdonensis TaxID=546108 RepID=A0ABW3KUV8_9BACI